MWAYRGGLLGGTLVLVPGLEEEVVLEVGHGAKVDEAVLLGHLVGIVSILHLHRPLRLLRLFLLFVSHHHCVVDQMINGLYA
jgi:hypothetical protein